MYKSSAVHASPFSYPLSSSTHRSLQEAIDDEPQAQTKPVDIDEQIEKARAEGFSEGRKAAEVAYQVELTRLRESVATAIHEFSAERATYFSQVEAEVVQLGVAIAKRILHREAQVDPGLLRALVRAQLQELDKTTSVSIHVNPSVVEDWHNSFKDISGIGVLGDPSIAKHACRLETDIGSTELSIDSQLVEIENGLFDLFPKLPNLAKQVLQ